MLGRNQQAYCEVSRVGLESLGSFPILWEAG